MRRSLILVSLCLYYLIFTSSAIEPPAEPMHPCLEQIKLIVDIDGNTVKFDPTRHISGFLFQPTAPQRVAIALTNGTVIPIFQKISENSFSHKQIPGGGIVFIDGEQNLRAMNRFGFITDELQLKDESKPFGRSYFYLVKGSKVLVAAAQADEKLPFSLGGKDPGQYFLQLYSVEDGKFKLLRNFGDPHDLAKQKGANHQWLPAYGSTTVRNMVGYPFFSIMTRFMPHFIVISENGDLVGDLSIPFDEVSDYFLIPDYPGRVTIKVIGAKPGEIAFIQFNPENLNLNFIVR